MITHYQLQDKTFIPIKYECGYCKRKALKPDLICAHNEYCDYGIKKKGTPK